MKNLFEQKTADEIIARIDTLQPTSLRQWGKMDDHHLRQFGA